MKKTSIFLLFVLISVYLHAQVSLLESSKTWYLGHSQSGFPHYFNTEIFTIDQDTLIEGILYKQVQITEDKYLNNWKYYAALREDTLGKVYLYDQEDSLERLIYDFTLSQGDTFYHKIYLPEHSLLDSVDTMIVNYQDSITLQTGEKRKRLTLAGLEHDFEWIEGIGSPWGLVYDSCAAPHVLTYWCGLNCVIKMVFCFIPVDLALRI